MASDARNASNKSAKPQNALVFLRADHEAVMDLFDKYEKAKNDEKKQTLADKICKELKAHATIEEEIFYPAIREAHPVKDSDDILDEADVEHDGAKKLIAEIESSHAGAELFDAQIKVLSEYIKHHVKEEYANIFPAARKADIDLKEMGQKLATRKRQLLTGK